MNYFDLIFTNHALDQMRRRGVSKEDAYEAFKHPDNDFIGKKGNTEFHKHFNGFEVIVIGKQNEKKEWVALSAWRNPPLAGTKDAIRASEWKEYKKAGSLGKIWISIKQQLGF